jgi:pantoate--beta-alanine ligase
VKSLRAVSELRRELAPARRGARRIGLVPTMGALHEGHLSLIRAARVDCDVVVVSLFVNPAQFNEAADLERYPRDEARDSELAAAAGADILFIPGADEVYPDGFASSVEVLGLTGRLEGETRGSEHFRGVTTVVTKLFGMAQPDVAYFGQKDFQQVLVIRRLVSDLNLPVEIVTLPTVREPDGLAMSSRNALLDPAARERALSIPAALQMAAEQAREGERSAETLTANARRTLLAAGAEPDYVALVDPVTLEPLSRLEGEALLAIAARVGEVRLIDNALLAAEGSARTVQPAQRKAVAACNA